MVETLTAEIKACTKCELRETCTQVVVGQGDLPADIIFVGEAPGKNEDEKGLPFVGRSGKLLRQLIHEANVPGRHYITNIVKCRPPNNRVPFPWEIEGCLPHLIRQVKEVVKPTIIVGVGKISTLRLVSPPHTLYNFNTQHGTAIDVPGGFKFVGMYHPSAALRNGAFKEKLINDLKALTNICADLNVN